ncbi:glycosyltransferase [Fluviicola sp.]|uniref:glycosyltransferase n=1 Tax=Fluviicola sp. TaxID=1917219 RepID=UPI0031DB805E
MYDLAPIALFVYNRPEHTRRTLESLKQNELASQSKLYIFSDGAKTPKDEEKVTEVREIIRNTTGFLSVEVIERTENSGLANSIISGVTQLISEYGQVIVYEDDLISSPHTLRYFNDALNHYRETEKVMHIGSYMFPIQTNNLPETFFFRAATSWGWATWERAWKHFEPDIDILLEQFDEQKKSAFAIDNSMNYWKQMQEFKSGKNNSWAIRWYASIFLKDGLTFNPSQSLVQNIGHDGSGVHSGINDIYEVPIYPKRITAFPDLLEENRPAYEALRTYFATRKGSLWARMKRFAALKWHQYFSK